MNRAQRRKADRQTKATLVSFQRAHHEGCTTQTQADRTFDRVVEQLTKVAPLTPPDSGKDWKAFRGWVQESTRHSWIIWELPVLRHPAYLDRVKAANVKALCKTAGQSPVHIAGLPHPVTS